MKRKLAVRKKAEADNAAKLRQATSLLIDRAIALIQAADASDGTGVKWVGTDSAGEKRTVEYSMADIAATLEKLARTGSAPAAGDDALTAFLRRLDDEAAAE